MAGGFATAAPPVKVPAPLSLGQALHRLARAQRTRLGALLAPHGLHAGQDLLLLAVWETPGLAQGILADALGIEPPTLTRMVQRLTRSGMLERRADAHDARVMRVYPTPKSRLLEGSVRRAWSELEGELVERLGEGESALFQRLALNATDAMLKAE